MDMSVRMWSKKETNLLSRSSINMNGKWDTFNVSTIWSDLIKSLMATYDDLSLDCIPPMLQPGERKHILIMQDESIFHTNEYRQHMWLAQDQQPIRKKGNGHAIHVSNFISETIGQIRLSEDQIADQLMLPEEHCLAAFEARKIIYPGKGFDAWWDLSQLIDQIKMFDITHPGCIAVFTFDWSSAHEGFAENTLNINNMNVNPGRKQRKLHDTIIPLNNPDPAPGEEDMSHMWSNTADDIPCWLYRSEASRTTKRCQGCLAGAEIGLE